MNDLGLGVAVSMGRATLAIIRSPDSTGHQGQSLSVTRVLYLVRRVSVSTPVDSMLPVGGLRLPRSRIHRHRIGRKSRVGFDGYCRSLGQSSSLPSPNISSGVQMIGIGMPSSVSNSWMRGRIFAFAMCLQFHVNRYCTR